jgi:DNA-binding NarL/FixJ family response regulator
MSVPTVELEPTSVLQGGESSPSVVLRVLLAHRHALVREGTRHILDVEPGYDVVAETLSLATAASLVEELKPDVLILGVDPEELESRTYVRQLRGILATTRVLVLNDAIPPQRLGRLGVTGWMASTASPVEVIAGIRAVAEGRTVSGSPTTIGAREGGLAEHPTPRELEVLALVERGLTTRAIAERLQTTRRTIHFHVGNLFTKLGASSRTEMVHLARRRGWLE